MKDRETILRLTCDFLEELSDRMGNDGCNDYEWPAGISNDTKAAILVAADGEDEDFRDLNVVNNWEVVNGLRQLLEDEIERAKA